MINKYLVLNISKSQVQKALKIQAKSQDCERYKNKYGGYFSLFVYIFRSKKIYDFPLLKL